MRTKRPISHNCVKSAALFLSARVIPGVVPLQSKLLAFPAATDNFDWKGTFIMNNDTKSYVVNLLETYQERQRKIALLHYELEHPARTSETEMISAMALGHGAGGDSGHTDGHVSDKTLYIALNYQNRADKLNVDIKEEIVVQLVELEQEQAKLEYYVSLLDKRPQALIRAIYFDECSLEEAARQFGIAPRTVRTIKKAALEKLASMYEYIRGVNRH